MDKEELALYQAFGNYATENLFWRLTYLNNAVFNTPLKRDIKQKLFDIIKIYKTIIESAYPTIEGKKLVAAMAENNQLFISYVDHLVRDSIETEAIKQQWKDNGQQIAHLLCKMNPYWHAMEWTAMIGHETDLLDAITVSMKTKNYASFTNMAPICQQIAVSMSAYMSKGICAQKQDQWAL